VADAEHDVIEPGHSGSRCKRSGRRNALSGSSCSAGRGGDVRGSLAAVVQGRSTAAAKGKHALLDQLKQMAADGGIDATLADWASHIRLLGNAGAHPSTVAPVSMEEAEEFLRLVNALLEYLYVMLAKVQRARAARSSSPAGLVESLRRLRSRGPGQCARARGISLWAVHRRMPGDSSNIFTASGVPLNITHEGMRAWWPTCSA
jgi:hypothetical protein